MPSDFDRRSEEELWASIDEYDQEAFRAKIEELVAELPTDSPSPPSNAHARSTRPDTQTERFRSTGRRSRWVSKANAGAAQSQLASSLRNLDQVSESVALLSAEREQPSDQLDDAVSGFLALALADVGREREAVSIALGALAPHLLRYQRSLGNYARELVDGE